MFDTTSVWNELGMNGKSYVTLDVGVDELAIIHQLHMEAREEGVTLRITRSPKLYGELYVYLRKTVH